MTEYWDIEELVVWAFREQQVEKYVSTLRGASLGPSQSLESGFGQTLMLVPRR